jgi:hypothetical protein
MNFAPNIKANALDMLAGGHSADAVANVFGVPVDVLLAWVSEERAALAVTAAKVPADS